MTDTEEDISLPASTPKDEASRSCTRQTPCKQDNCPICSEPIPGTHHVSDLTQELETTPLPKKTSKPPAPPDHVIISLTTDLQQACLDNDLEDIKILLDHADLHLKNLPDLFKYDRSELTKILATAHELLKGREISQPAPLFYHCHQPSTSPT